ncbi:3'(2'),5'-bisphosphate nucleotidase CysQ [Govanella unica]|uniref:3'(2'),5'-bisphosphate nucleotidase CysQ n=1 Tax=Govanella unica TaxID=2975056 RepID=A0A9X3TWY0_9PROT|nr:3'(2'),5'-bisphosphate nucleotidase CysQ [Govania unica]
MPDTTRWLAPLEQIARDAGAAIMEIYAHEIAVRQKDDLSPVTDADEAAERIILAGLKLLDPDTPVVAEESMNAGQGPAEHGTRFWLVDPLDGTKEFIRRHGEFTVNIALIEDGRPTLGVVYAPAIGSLYLGAVGHGATKILDSDRTTRLPITAREGDRTGLVAVASKSHRTPGTNVFLDRLPIAESRAAGSSLKFCLVAEGAADIYPRIGPTMEWDTAAGHAVLAAAGGRVVTLDGVDLDYGKPDYRNPDYYAYGLWPKGLVRPERP